MKYGDLIDRQAAVDAVRGIIDDTPDNELPLEDVAFRDGVQYAISVLCNVPSAQPDGWLARHRDEILKAGMEGREFEFRINGRLFAIREKAQ